MVRMPTSEFILHPDICELVFDGLVRAHKAAERTALQRVVAEAEMLRAELGRVKAAAPAAAQLATIVGLASPVPLSLSLSDEEADDL